jgi:antitoxin YefM
MDQQTTLSTTAARKEIFKITKDVQKPGVIYTLTENGRPRAVIMSAEEFESWRETMEVKHDFPDILADQAEAEADLTAGRTISLEDFLAEEGYFLAEKTHGKLSRATKPKSRRKLKKA